MRRPPKFLVLAVLATVGGLGCPVLAGAQSQYQQLVNAPVPAKSKEKGDKLALLNKISRFYLAGATAFDMQSTAQILDHPTVARTEAGKLLAYYHGQEVGWAGSFGRRNMFAVTAANVALNAGLTLASQKLYHKGGRWRVLAIVVTAAKATDNLVAGIENTRYSGTIDGQIRATTGYSGPIIWSH